MLRLGMLMYDAKICQWKKLNVISCVGHGRQTNASLKKIPLTFAYSFYIHVGTCDYI